jgi:hypothetical protein
MKAYVLIPSSATQYHYLWIAGCPTRFMTKRTLFLSHRLPQNSPLRDFTPPFVSTEEIIARHALNPTD